MRDTIPKEDFLLLLRTNTSVTEEEIEKLRLGFLEDRLTARLQVAQIRKDALFKLFSIEDRSAGLRETKQQNLYNVRSSYKELSLPEDAGNRVATRRRQLVRSNRWVIGFGPKLRRRRQKLFQIFNLNSRVNIKGTGLLAT